MLETQFSDDFTVLLNVHGGKTESDAVQYRHLGVWNATGDMCSTTEILAGQCADIFGYSENAPYTTLNGVDAQAVPAYDEGNYDFEAQNDTEFWGVSVTADWTLGNYSITSITSFDKMDDFRPEESDGGPNNILTGELSVNKETLAQEFQVKWQDDKWSWIAGLYYLNDEATDNTAFDILRDLRFSAVGDDVNCSAPAGNPTGFCPEGFIFKSKSGTNQEINSLALYFDTSVNINDDLKLSMGVRYTDEEINHTSFFFYY